MTARVKLSELIAVRKAMSPGPFACPDPVHPFWIEDANGVYVADCDVAAVDLAANTAGIVATHNAADVLIEVVTAAMELQAATHHQDTWWCGPPAMSRSDSRYERLSIEAEERLEAAVQALHVALSKVQP